MTISIEKKIYKIQDHGIAVILNKLRIKEFSQPDKADILKPHINISYLMVKGWKLQQQDKDICCHNFHLMLY